MNDNNVGLTRNMTSAVNGAVEYVHFFKHEFIMPEHMLMALLSQQGFKKALTAEGVDHKKMNAELVEWLSKQEKVPKRTRGIPEPSTLFKKMFTIACSLSLSKGNANINISCFVRAILKLQNSEAAFLLNNAIGDRLEDFIKQIYKSYPAYDDEIDANVNNNEEEEEDEEEEEEDDYFYDEEEDLPQDWHELVTCISDLVDQHNPLIGRENELERTIQVLCRAEKNNPHCI